MYRVQIQINTAYNDSPETVDTLQLIADNLPPFQDYLSHQQTVSDLIFTNYGVLENVDFNTYRFLLQEIATLNSIENFSTVPEGHLLLPTLPKKALTEPSLINPNNVKPKVFEFTLADDINNTNQLYFSSSAAIEEAYRQGASSAHITFAAPYYWLDSILATPFGQSHRFKVMSGPLQVELSNSYTSTPRSIQFLSKEEIVRLTDLIDSTEKTVNLFILDTGWPNEKAYQESIQYFHEIMDNAWQTLGIPNPAPRNIPPYVPPSHSHCQEIAAALAPLVELNERKTPVRVIYLPMSLEQAGEVILQELLWFNQIMASVSKIEDLKKMGAGLRNQEIRKLGREANKIVRSLPNKICPTTTDKTPCRTVTDIAILNAINDIAYFDSEQRRTPYFINISWNPAARRLYKLVNNAQARGMYLVSAGNIPRDIIKTGKLFGNLVSYRADVITVLNLDQISGKPTCKSSFVEKPKEYPGIVMGFRGDIDQDICGTSLATPRAGWFLALGEATRVQDIPGYLMISQIRKGIRATQTVNTANDYSHIYFHPIHYLDQINNSN